MNKKGGWMKMKRFNTIISILFFLGSVVFLSPCCSYALNPQPEPPAQQIKVKINPVDLYVGTIIKIEGAKFTVRDEKGIEKIAAGGISGLKVGDKVTVKGGNIIKINRKLINPQPEPPKTK
jgi:hypothetical protein